MRRITLLAAVLILASCSGPEKPPSTVADACQMRSERPHWFEAMNASQQRWGVPVAVQLATISRESSFRATAKPTKRVGSGLFSRNVPLSSAYGYAQAVDGTWDWYVRDTGRRGADRDSFADSADFIGWYMNRNSRVNGIPLNDAYNQYLAYHEGGAGYANGTHLAKGWLPAVARDVQAWAVLYNQQLASCSAR